MKMLILVAIVLFLNLAVFVWFHRMAGLRIIVLRQQLSVYKRMSKKPLLKNRDRLFWSLLSNIWKDWASELILVKPETAYGPITQPMRAGFAHVGPGMKSMRFPVDLVCNRRLVGREVVAGDSPNGAKRDWEMPWGSTCRRISAGSRDGSLEVTQAARP